MPITDSKPSSDKLQTQDPQIIQYAAPYPQQFEDDTIDLYELWITLWNKRWLVIAVTVIAALGSVVYALLAPHIYKAEAMLLPPSSKDVQSLNVQGVQGVPGLQGVQGVHAAGAFAAFQKNLSSRSLQKKFIDEEGLMDILAPNRTPETRDIEILESFSKMMKIEDKGGFSISMESSDPVFAAKLVNDYVDFFDLETVRHLVADAKNNIQEQVVDIEYNIASKRQMTKLRREDQVLRYQEAMTIARTLGIKKRVDATSIIQNTGTNIDISTTSTPLYYLGIEALNAEINILKNRESDDPFISGLRDLQEQLTLLRSIKISEEDMHSVSVDQAAYPPKNRIKPNRRLIVSLSTVVGLFLGIFLVYFVSFVQKQKEIHSE
jgi:chain length determinant protein (polysaccharide antigen chain regulator)